MSPVEMSIPAGTAYVAIIRLAIGSLARAAGFDEERIDDIRIAVSEACTNAVLAHEEAGSTEAIKVAWTEAADRIIVQVEDRVRARGADGVSPQDSQGFSTRMVMSVALLQEMADDLAIEPSESGGTTSRLTFSR
jgi:serine/threonine-protein kinase RsbW